MNTYHKCSNVLKKMVLVLIHCINNEDSAVLTSPGRVVQSVWHLTRKSGPGYDTRSGHTLSFLRQLSVTGESMCTKYWLTA